MQTIFTKKVDAAELEQKVKKMYRDVVLPLIQKANIILKWDGGWLRS